MLVITARNVNDALYQAVKCLNEVGVRRSSRNGKVTMFPFPVATRYLCPTQRVLWNTERDANPFFHFFEGLWMLAGRKDVKWIQRFSKHITTFSDDGQTFNGGYGYRWRRHFGRDQLDDIVLSLKKNPNDRRCVLQMWDAEDLLSTSKDVPCNTAAYISIDHLGRLTATVTNRSNDMIWGCYGANAVHFSMMMEYLAGRLGVPIGDYYQVSNNLHMYDFNKHQIRTVVEDAESDGAEEPYQIDLVSPYPMFDKSSDPEIWDRDLSMFMEDPYCFGYSHRFFNRVAKPLWAAHSVLQQKQDPERFETAKAILAQCHATDWRLACEDWVGRRQQIAQERAAKAAQAEV